MELVENLPNDRHYLKYVPVPTESCVLCKGRTSKGEEPACVSTCMASCMRYGKIEELAEQMRRKPRQVLWVPRASETRSLVPEFR
jgi:anaerobic dimethyl sulfoxide reductase subunit B (iron-sulfur subunit)